MPQFAGGVSYTPFFKEAMGGISGALGDRRTRAMEKQKSGLFSGAMMGNPKDLQDLYAMDPQMGRQAEEQLAQRKATTSQETMAKDTAFKKESQEIVQEIAAFPDYASAQAFGQRMKDYMTQKYPDRTKARGQQGPEFTEQNFNEIKQIAGRAPAKRNTSVVNGRVVDTDTGDVVYETPEGSTISDIETMLIDTPDGQVLINKQTGEEIETFAAAPPTKGEKEPTGAELKATGYLSRMKNAESEIARLLNDNPQFDPADWIERSRGKSNVTASPEFQQYKQAADDWIRAKLRNESGAVIADEEMNSEYDTYFPKTGDGPEVIAQKKRARVQAEKQMGFAAGRGAALLEPATTPDTETVYEGAPEIGTVVDGFEYTGGDPALEGSWKAV